MDGLTHIKVRDLRKIYGWGKKAFHALDGVSFELGEGERVGLIGSNGAGKSTLLSILSGYAGATGGQIEVQGAVNAILEIGTGNNPEMTGRQNLNAGAKLYGLTAENIAKKIDEIIEFIDIGDYIDRPVKTYSTGMAARLSFGMLSFIQPQILIIDEALGVGDASFNKKSAERIKALCAEGKLLLLVSHSMQTILEMTERCIWLEHGRVMMDGPSAGVTTAYLEHVRAEKEHALRELMSRQQKPAAHGATLAIEKIALCNSEAPAPRMVFDIFDDIRISITLRANECVAAPDAEISVENVQAVRLIESRLSADAAPLAAMEAGEARTLTATLPHTGLVQGVYQLTCAAYSGGQLADRRLCVFEMLNENIHFVNIPLVYTDIDVDVRPHGQGKKTGE